MKTFTLTNCDRAAAIISVAFGWPHPIHPVTTSKILEWIRANYNKRAKFSDKNYQLTLRRGDGLVIQLRENIHSEETIWISIGVDK